MRFGTLAVVTKSDQKITFRAKQDARVGGRGNAAEVTATGIAAGNSPGSDFGIHGQTSRSQTNRSESRTARSDASQPDPGGGTHTRILSCVKLRLVGVRHSRDRRSGSNCHSVSLVRTSVPGTERNSGTRRSRFRRSSFGLGDGIVDRVVAQLDRRHYFWSGCIYACIERPDRFHSRAG